jgi:hypothetical protein
MVCLRRHIGSWLLAMNGVPQKAQGTWLLAMNGVPQKAHRKLAKVKYLVCLQRHMEVGKG